MGSERKRRLSVQTLNWANVWGSAPTGYSTATMRTRSVRLAMERSRLLAVVASVDFFSRGTWWEMSRRARWMWASSSAVDQKSRAASSKTIWSRARMVARELGVAPAPLRR